MPSLQDLGHAIARHPNPVKMIFLGFDLWLEVLGSGKVKTTLFKKGGLPTTEEEPIKTAKVPLMAVGEHMVVSVDITLPPDGFRLAP
ncbi:hypothetical protein [Plastoroseomonas arctica]|uniref:Uncharacterized protein n=1 Tax=Plastoroseomonas arctica TaxID=1509237 RepID=A0AAF1JYB5_9PROT|nr:hypothetical protein [Plastoroseomonas arctica]MBR0656602.1 hypothetical protein [Plastoroseomonas arctica]